MAPQLKLTYFDAPGRAELTRLVLNYGKIDFVDERITGEEFGKLKPTLPFGQLPALQIDDLVVAQSFAIARYAARVAGLYPQNDIEAVKVDMILDAVKDIFDGAIKAMFAKSDELKAEFKAKLIDEVLPKMCSGMEKQVKGDYFLGENVSVADLAVYDAFTSLPAKIPEISLKDYPKLQAIYDRIAANENIIAYRKSRE